MLKPRRLRSGDRIAVVAPASPFPRHEFDAGIAELTQLGFEPVFDDRVFERDGFVAGSAAMRAQSIADAWRNPSIAAVIGIRGGYGSAQLLPHLDPTDAVGSRKPFVGYSDLTALLVFLTCGAGLVSFHGPMVADRFGRGTEKYDRGSFLRVLMHPEPVGALTGPQVEVVRAGEASGPLHGGNLAQLVASLGTPYAFDPPPGHVLFLDEVGERPYRIDRMLTQLRLSGLLARASGIVVGELPRCDEPDGSFAGRAVLANSLRDFHGPVVVGFPSGHTAGPALTIPLGVKARLVARGEPRLVIEEAAVE